MPSNGNEKRIRPQQHEVEVSVFGTGFGESIVVHLGLDRWVVVDSCRNPNSKKPVALEYLGEIGVDVPESLLLVVATHWDDDHIGGLAEVFAFAKNAVFACPATVNDDEFKHILATVTGTRQRYDGSGAGEMFEIMEELAKRGSRYPTPKLAVAHKDLLEICDTLPVRVQALSPSDAEIVSALERLRNIPRPAEHVPRLRLPRFESNDASVVISIQIGQRELILLGADLEERGLAEVGWQAVVEGWPEGRGKHGVFKVAHHGSSNGHLDAAWDRLLEESPWAVVTSFSSGKNNLPKAIDCERILRRTEWGMITTHPSRSRYKDRKPAVRRTIEEIARSAYVSRSRQGHVRLRCDLGANSDWICERFGSTIPIDAALISNLRLVERQAERRAFS
jgi:beta-lactamase superfamily II metal-dependent hydrolase